jgi:hypothetical protein
VTLQVLVHLKLLLLAWIDSSSRDLLKLGVELARKLEELLELFKLCRRELRDRRPRLCVQLEAQVDGADKVEREQGNKEGNQGAIQ